MPEKSMTTSRILLIVLSTCLFLATIAKVAASITGNYGNSLFSTLDDVSDALFLPWLAVLIVYLFSQERKRSGK